MAALPVFGYTLEGALALAGLLLLWRLALSPQARVGPAPNLVPPWPGPASDLVLALVCAFAGAVVLPGLVALGLRLHPPALLVQQLWLTCAFQGGLLLGIGLFGRLRPESRPPPPAPPGGSLRAGAGTFLVSLPLVFAVGCLWQLLLARFGFEARPQDTVDLFQNLPTPALKALFVLIAIVAAPVSEELIFRAGIFRFLRGRIPRGWAVAISALLFGGMHLLESPADGLGSLAQLVVLGAVFALAYERTGRIGTSIVAHGIFNLNTLVALLCGVNS
jgi:membrane protease YdiL (CAAX protease family)